MRADAESRIGLLCKDDQPVFTTVAERLREAGHAVQFLDPRAALSTGQINDLSLLVNKQVFPHVFPALRYARQTGTPLWNNLPATIAFGSRLIGLTALEEVGFRTPPVQFHKPDGEYVAKDCFVWNSDPELNGEGDFYQELIPTEPVDYKYHAVHDGSHVQMAGRRVTSKLYGPKRFLSHVRATETYPGYVTSSNEPTSEVSGWTSSKTTRTDFGPSISILQQATGIPD